MCRLETIVEDNREMRGTDAAALGREADSVRARKVAALARKGRHEHAAVGPFEGRQRDVTMGVVGGDADEHEVRPGWGGRQPLRCAGGRSTTGRRGIGWR